MTKVSGMQMVLLLTICTRTLLGTWHWMTLRS